MTVKVHIKIDGARFEGWTRAAAPQGGEWVRLQNWIACQIVEIE
jgi:hypothetical protein